MALLKLREYEQRYRPGLKPRNPVTLAAAARNGHIPGAFQMVTGGDWWVDTDIHDQIIRERIEATQLAACANDSHDGLSAEEEEKVNQILEKLNVPAA